MIDNLLPGAPFLVTALWQTTLALALGTFLCAAWRRYPGRAHFCIVMGLAASVALPVAATAVRHANWGLLTPASPAATGSPPTVPAPETAQLPPAGPTAEEPAPWKSAVSAAAPWIAAIWLAVSGLFLLKILMNLCFGIRLLANARPLVNERLHAVLESAAALMNVRRIPITFTTRAVRCPAIWCWAIHPSLLLPDSIRSGSGRWNDRQWLAVFLHELAHMTRRDQFAAIIAETVCALLWWHPLAWWSRARLNELSDEACDRWAVARGHTAEAYAETLLDMIPQRRSLSALSMVSSVPGLKRRLRTIMDPAPAPPHAGRAWTMANVLMIACLVVAVACMQTRSEPEPPGETAATVALKNPGVELGDIHPEAWAAGAPVDGVEYIWDRKVAKTGRASLCLRKTGQRYFPVAQWSQKLSISPADRTRQFRLSACIKAEQAHKAILDLQCVDAQGGWSHKWAAYIGAQESGDPPASHDWRMYSGEIDVPPETVQIIVALQIYGPGTVWFDDIALSLVEMKSTESKGGQP